MNQEKEEMRPRKLGVLLVSFGANLPTIGCVLLLLIHAAVASTGGTHTSPDQLRLLYEKVALSWSGVQQGSWLALLVHGFFHGNWSHVLVNALLFYYTAARLSHVLSAGRILLLFGLSSLGGGMVYLLSQALLSGVSPAPLVGASGGVMGLFLAQSVIYSDSRMLLLPISGRNMGRGFLIASLLLFLMTPQLRISGLSEIGHWLSEVLGAGLFQIGHLYHFSAGLLGMVAVNYCLPKLVTLEELQLERRKREEKAEFTV